MFGTVAQSDEHAVMLKLQVVASMIMGHSSGVFHHGAKHSLKTSLAWENVCDY